MTYTFQYSDWPVRSSGAFPSGLVVKRAAVPVHFMDVPKPVRITAFLDTCSDSSMFPASLASRLGIELDQSGRQPILGSGGDYIGILHTIHLRVADAFTLELPAAFVGTMTGEWGVLGQLGFFDQVRVSFELREGIFQIETVLPLDGDS